MAALVLGGVAACEPAPIETAAVGMENGQPTVVLWSCSFGPMGLSVYRDEPKDTGKTLVRWAVNNSHNENHVNDIVIFDAPSGWTIDTQTQVGTSPYAFTIQPLTMLESGVHYAANGNGMSHTGIPVNFTTADLAKLGPSQVLAPARHGGGTRVMDRIAFLADARRAC